MCSMGMLLAIVSALSGAQAATQPSHTAAVIPGDKATVLGRDVAQLGGRWTIRWRVRWVGPRALVLDPTRVTVDYQAVVSNPECPGHGLPRPSRTRFVLANPSGADVAAHVIRSGNPNLRCRERLDVTMAVDGKTETRLGPSGLTVPPGGVLVIRVDLVHEHPVYGRWVALLGVRDIELTLGRLRLRDRVVLPRVLNHAAPPSTWTPPKPMWRDTKVYHSAPDSWGVFAGKDGRSVLTLSDVPVRFSTPYELVFWARVDADDPRQFRVRVQQMQAAPRHYKHLAGEHTLALQCDDRWHRCRLVWTNLPQTNRVMIQFKFVGAKFGGAWIDDVQLRPLPAPRRSP